MSEELMLTLQVINLSSLHNFLGLVQISLALFGYYISFFFRRSRVFQFKVICVFSFLMVGGVGSFIIDYMYFHMFQHLLTLGFALCATILYWREAKYCRRCTNPKGCRRG
jgi:hypothetical protein